MAIFFYSCLIIVDVAIMSFFSQRNLNHAGPNRSPRGPIF
jgi:hypothetical protein